MGGIDSFFNQHLERFNTMSVSTTFIIFIFWIFLLLLMCYSLNHIFCKKQDLHRRVKIYTVLSTIAFKSYIGLLISSMIFYQLKMMRKYTYLIAISYIFFAIAKQSMYFLFLHTLYITFKRSQYQISSSINKFVVSLIILNFLIYLSQTYFWIKYRQTSRKSIYTSIWHLQLSTIPIEMFYALFIVGLFGHRLFMINLARINEQKTQKYAHRLRAATNEIIKEHIEKIKLHRSMSCDTNYEEDDDIDFTETNTQQTAPSPRSLSFNHFSPTFKANNSHPADHTLSFRKTPSLRQRKSMNIHRFNKENKELLDKLQLSMIDTAAKYTVLSCVAFITSLISGTFIGVAEIMYNGNGDKSESYMDSTLYFEFMILFMYGFNAIISDLCVLLRYNDTVLARMYGIFCCCCSVCCKHCFMYFSIRRIMTTVEDKLAQQVEAECDLIAIETDLSVQNKKNSLTPTKNIHIDLQKLQNINSFSNTIASNYNNTTPVPTTPVPTTPVINIAISSADNKDVIISDENDKKLSKSLKLKQLNSVASDDEVSSSNSNINDMDKDIIFVDRKSSKILSEISYKQGSVAVILSSTELEHKDGQIIDNNDQNHIQSP